MDEMVSSALLCSAISTSSTNSTTSTTSDRSHNKGFTNNVAERQSSSAAKLVTLLLAVVLACVAVATSAAVQSSSLVSSRHPRLQRVSGEGTCPRVFANSGFATTDAEGVDDLIGVDDDECCWSLESSGKKILHSSISHDDPGNAKSYQYE
eukprot:CAMPEP_0177794840 /NCGR_PEP_ID=MMETSP0491_2-20121128/25880_1 /TAXON_ID=63592 /ORGANISM="Tetraselmis chuii, Strain PLY429" /LENGTH=150 /DNA_ID=CAMNT_0019317563 /DNA_START=356 /DNA_END=806 /DNA_ORIENTATION=+